MNKNSKRIAIIVMLLLLLGMGALTFYLQSQTGDDQSADDSDAATSGKVCGEACSADSDCRAATVSGTPVGCRNGQCVNLNCPDATVYGTRCDCNVNTFGCGEPCGGSFGLCATGYACTYRAQQAPYCDGSTTPQNTKAVCVPRAVGSDNRGQIAVSLYGTSTTDFSTWVPFERRQCAPRPDTNNNYLYHPQIPATQAFTDNQFVKDYVCGQKIVYVCDETTNSCEGTAIKDLGGSKDFFLELTACQATGCGGQCGDGVVNSTEECDDGNTAEGDGCSEACAVTTECNDGIDNDEDGNIDCESGNEDPGCFPDGSGGGGECDPDDPTELDNAVCGNNIVETGEGCDDGNTVSGDGCSATCNATTVCNDGLDNDGDNLSDCADPGCFTDGRGGGECIPTKNSEQDAIVYAPPQCGDGVDNDGDGRIDCTAGAEDPGCFPNGNGGGGVCSTSDPTEYDIPATAIFGDTRDYLVYGGILIAVGIVMLRSRKGGSDEEWG